MMRLHQVHVRVTPRLRRGVAGASTTSITQVIATMVRVTSMVIPEKNAKEFYIGIWSLWLHLKTHRAAYIGSILRHHRHTPHYLCTLCIFMLTVNHFILPQIKFFINFSGLNFNGQIKFDTKKASVINKTHLNALQMQKYFLRLYEILYFPKFCFIYHVFHSVLKV